MKLLFDENLPPVLAHRLAGSFPGSRHVRDCGLKGAPDDAIWAYARAQSFVVVSRDADFYARSLLHGAPPKLIWLRPGNCATRRLLALLIDPEAVLVAFGADAAERVLILR